MLRLAGAVVTTMFVGAGCAASTDSAGRTDAAAIDSTTGAPVSSTVPPNLAAARPPAIGGLELIVADDVATLIAVVDDADGDLESVEIAWGDGATETLSLGSPTVRVDHRYPASGRYVVSIAAADASGLATIETATASIDEPAAPGSTPPPAPALHRGPHQRRLRHPHPHPHPLPSPSPSPSRS
jgi:hypothetical protein